VPRYAVRLDIHTAKPLTQPQLDTLNGGRWEMLATGKPRSKTLTVSLEMDGGDVVGALARSLNEVLDVVAGEVTHAEVTELRPRAGGKRRRR
jgi:hypothetical protein